MIGYLGDIHGMAEILKRAAVVSGMNGATALIQVGDYGLFDKEVERPEIQTYVIDGNHDHFPAIRDLTEPTEISPNITFMPRGSTAVIDGKLHAFMGGASSVDKAFRLREGWPWYEEEVLLPEQVARLDHLDSVDVLVTHCPPQSVIDAHFNPNVLAYFGLPPTWRDPTAALVETLWRRLGSPPLFCGHMHRSVDTGTVRILDINELVVH